MRLKSLFALVLLLAAPAGAEVSSIVTFPGSTNGAVQFNRNGTFAGDVTSFSYSTNTKTLNITQVRVSTLTINGLTYTWPQTQAGGLFLRNDGAGGLTWETPSTFSISSGVALGVLDGSVYISTPATSDLSFNANQFIVSLQGATTASIRLDGSSVTLMGVLTAQSPVVVTGSQFSLDKSSVTLLGPNPAVGGDLTGTLSTAQVADDSHNHTGSTISNLDISADTNLTISAPITLTNDTVGIDKSSVTLLGPSIDSGELPAGGYDGTYVKVAGDAMTGQLTVRGSSITATGANGIRATYLVSGGSLAARNLSNTLVAVDSNGVLISTTVSSGGGAASIAISTSSVIVSSPTPQLDFNGSQVTASVSGGTTTITLSPSSVTLFGANVLRLSPPSVQNGSLWVTSGTVSGAMVIGTMTVNGSASIGDALTVAGGVTPSDLSINQFVMTNASKKLISVPLTPLPEGSTNYVQVDPTSPQSGAFNISSGTVMDTLYVGTGTYISGPLQQLVINNVQPTPFGSPYPDSIKLIRPASTWNNLTFYQLADDYFTKGKIPLGITRYDDKLWINFKSLTGGGSLFTTFETNGDSTTGSTVTFHVPVVFDSSQRFSSTTTFQSSVVISSVISLGGSFGTSGQVMTSNGVGTNPTWQTPAAGGGGSSTATVVAGSGLSQSISGSTITLSINYGSTNTWTAAQIFSSATITTQLNLGSYGSSNRDTNTPLTLVTRHEPVTSSASQGIYSEYNRFLGGGNAAAGINMSAIRGIFVSTSAGANILADGTGVHGQAIDAFDGLDGVLEGVQSYVHGRGTALHYMGSYNRAKWASVLPTGTTSTITGGYFEVSVSSSDFTTARATGTKRTIWIGQGVGGGAPGQSHALYSDDLDPSYFRGYVGFGTKLPAYSVDVQDPIGARVLYGITFGTATGNGAGITNLNASNLASGQASSTVLPSTISYTTKNETISGFKTFTASSVTINSAQNVQLMMNSSFARGPISGSFIQITQNDGNGVVAGDRLGGFVFSGLTSTPGTIGNGAGILAYATGTYTSSSYPTKMTFEAAAPGATTRTQVLSIFHYGVGIGTGVPQDTLDVRGNQRVSGRIWISSNSIMPGTTVYADGTMAATRIVWPDGTVQVSSPSAGGGSGDITDVIAGTGLTGGAASGAATLNVVSTVAYQTSANTFTSSQTITAPLGLNVTYGVSVGSITGLGSGLTGLNGSNITSGQISSNVLPSTISYTTKNETITGVKTFTSSVTVSGSGDGEISLSIGNSTYTVTYASAPQTVGYAAVWLSTSGALGSAPLGGGGAGDITDVIAGTGLTGGAASGAATLAVASTQTFLTVTVTSNTVVRGTTFYADGTTVISAGTQTASGVFFDYTSSTMTVSSATVSGQLRVGTLQGASLATCGDSTHALSWTGGNFGCQAISPGGGGGSSTLAIATGTLNGFASPVSSPTAAINFSSNAFTASLAGSATAFINLNFSSVTAMGGTFNGVNQLVKLDGSGNLPALNGSALTNLNGSNIASGQISSTVLPSTISYTPKIETISGGKTHTSSLTVLSSVFISTSVDSSGQGVVFNSPIKSVYSITKTSNAVLSAGFFSCTNNDTDALFAGQAGHVPCVFGLFQDLPTSNNIGYGLEGRTNGTGLNVSEMAGVLGLGTHSGAYNGILSGLIVRTEKYAQDGVTPLSSGTLRQLWIKDPVGSGIDVGRSHSLYNESTKPSYSSASFIVGGDTIPITDSVLYTNARNTSGTFPSIVHRSGVSGRYFWMGLGVTGTNASIVVPASNNAFMTGTNPFDLGLRTEGATNKVVIGAGSGQGTLYVNQGSATVNGSLTVTASSLAVNGVYMVWPASGTIGNYLRMVSSNVLSWDAAGGGGSTSPGGSSWNVQVASAGAFSGVTGFNVNPSSIVISNAYTTYTSTLNVSSSMTITGVSELVLNNASLRFSTMTHSVENIDEGETYGGGTQGAIVTKISGATQTLSGVIFTLTASSANFNTANAVDMLGNGVNGDGTSTTGLTLPENFWTVGKTLHIVVVGTFTTTSTPAIVSSITVGGAVIVSTNNINTIATTGLNYWELKAILTCRSTGATGKVYGTGSMFMRNTKTAATFLTLMDQGNTVDTTAPNKIQIFTKWGTANASNNFTANNAYIEVKN